MATFDVTQSLAWAFLLLFVGFGFALFRLAKGPSLPDRVVALDLMATLSIGFVVLRAVQTDFSVYLDVAVILGLVAFLGTAAFARFVEKRQIRKAKEENQRNGNRKRSE